MKESKVYELNDNTMDLLQALVNGSAELEDTIKDMDSMALDDDAELEAEYELMAGKSLKEYLKTSRIGMKGGKTRKERIELYNNTQKAKAMPLWCDFYKKLDDKFLGRTCSKCGGSGNLGMYAHVQGGICFDCNGTGRIQNN